MQHKMGTIQDRITHVDGGIQLKFIISFHFLSEVDKASLSLQETSQELVTNVLKLWHHGLFPSVYNSRF
jgi:hypothetical protein